MNLVDFIARQAIEMPEGWTLNPRYPLELVNETTPFTLVRDTGWWVICDGSSFRRNAAGRSRRFRSPLAALKAVA